MESYNVDPGKRRYSTSLSAEIMGKFWKQQFMIFFFRFSFFAMEENNELSQLSYLVFFIMIY